MSHGLDQYLVNRLTNEHVFLVVTDPKRADACFQDRVGDSLRDQLESIAPTPAPAKAEEPKKAEDLQKTDKDQPEPQKSVLVTETANKLSAPQSNFGRAKGTVFLVDSKSRQVLWSVFDEPKDSSSRQLDRTASDIVSRLKRDLK